LRFIHCGVHRKAFRSLIRGEAGTDEDAPEPVIIGCPSCGQWYFADLKPDVRPADLEIKVWQGEELLLAECPDHAHRFEVDGIAADSLNQI
jgi:hypothetical protein